MSEPQRLGEIFKQEIEKTQQDDGQRQVALTRNGQRFVFRYQKGDEDKIRVTLAGMVKDCEVGLLDASVVSFQLDKFTV